LRGALSVLHSAPQDLRALLYEARKAENMLKHVKALEMKRFNQLPLSAQERDAYSSDAYKQAIERDAVASADLFVLKAKLEAAKITIDVWRTEKATERASFG